MIHDASAILAFLLAEPGEGRIAEALIDGPSPMTVNFSEVATKYVLRGAKLRAATLADRLPGTLVAVDRDLALMADLTRPAGLSLSDRVCLALRRRTGRTVLTADRARRMRWGSGRGDWGMNGALEFVTMKY